MQDRTPEASGIPHEVQEAEELLASGFDHDQDISLKEVFRDAYDAGWDWVMDAPGMTTVESAQHLPERVAAGVRWLLANPVSSVPDNDALALTRGIAYHEGVRRAVDCFMKVPRIQRRVANLVAPGVPGQRPRAAESGS